MARQRQARSLVTALVLGLATLTQGCYGVLYAFSGGEGRHVSRFVDKGFDYNVRSIKRHRDPWRLRQHVSALGFIGDPRAVPHLVDLMEDMVDRNRDSGIALEATFKSLMSFINYSLAQFLGVPVPKMDDTLEAYSSRAKEWRQLVTLRGGTPRVRAEYVDIRYVNLGKAHFGGRDTWYPKLRADDEVAGALWQEWLSSGSPQPWRVYLALSMWRRNSEPMLDFVTVDPKRTDSTAFQIDRDAQLAGVPVEKWQSMDFRSRSRLLAEELERRGISKQDWERLKAEEATLMPDEKGLAFSQKMEDIIHAGTSR